MKNNILILFACLAMAAPAAAQNINWQAFQPEQKHLVQLQTGWDYGLTLGLGYGHKFKILVPVIANIEYSFPTGKELFDDFKVRVGGQAEVIRLGGFSLTAKLYSPFRRYENNKVRFVSFGGEVSGVVGYYRKSWFVAGEFGFDKAIATHIQHSREALEAFPGAQSGWYVPTGGNYFYGLQAGFSFRGNDISLKAGNLTSQGWETEPFIPRYAALGYSRRF